MTKTEAAQIKSENFFAEFLRRCLSRSLGALSGRMLIMMVLFVCWQLASGRIVPHFWISDPVTIMRTVVEWIADGPLWWSEHSQQRLATPCKPMEGPTGEKL